MTHLRSRATKARTNRRVTTGGRSSAPTGVQPGTLCTCTHPNLAHMKNARNGGRVCRHIDTRTMTRCGCVKFTPA